MTDRRRFLALTAAGLAAPALGRTVDLGLPGGPGERAVSMAFPGKGAMIVQRTVPPLLETPMAVFNDGVLTPTERFFVRWHYPFPTEIDVDAYRLTVAGQVARPLSLSLKDLKALPKFEIVAVNQCAGNSRGLSQPRVAGAQWRHGAMGNARWTGVRLRDVLEMAGLKPGAVAVRFGGMDAPLMEGAPDFAKALALDHARDGEVMLAWGMNGADLPILHGFPLRLVVPGWYSTYWVKMLDSIEILDKPDDGYWMSKAYLVPDTADGGIVPGTKEFAKRPISRMVPRAFITSVGDGARVAFAPEMAVGGLAMGGDCGVARVEISPDGGQSWGEARLGPGQDKYGFRRFEGLLPGKRGAAVWMARCTNDKGAVQAMTGTWNPGGFMRGQVEPVRVVVA